MTACDQETQVYSDYELVERTRQGDEDAFAELISRHYQHCASLAAFIFRNRSLGSDEVQEACWKAFKHINQYKATAEFSPWLHRIVANECLMALRVNRRRQLVGFADGQAGTDREYARAYDQECDLVNSEVVEVVRREIRFLPSLLRNVVVLRDVEGLPMVEVAAQLGLTVAAAKSRLLRARLEVRSRLQRHLGKNGHHPCRSSVRNLPAWSARSTSYV